MPRTRDKAARERYEVLHRMLEERRTEIHDKLRSLRETLPAASDLVRDAEEQSVDDLVRDLDVALMQMKSETLSRIDEAMQRLEVGRYGICADCGAPIAASRLEALPFAILCRPCQEAEESRAARERAAAPPSRLFGEAEAVPYR
jgi:DnaK suppressor protein